MEVAYEVHEKVSILIASQYLAWNYFAYDAYQGMLGATTTPTTVARRITRFYADRARSEDLPFTISALNLQRAEPTLQAIDELAAELTALVTNDSANLHVLQEIWQDSQKFESNGDMVINELDFYIDLVDWTERVNSEITSSAVQERAAQLLKELSTGSQTFIIEGSHYAESNYLPATNAYIDLSGANGLSIFYPPQPNMVVYDRYINHQFFQFTSMSRWTNFLRAQVGVPSGPLDPPTGPLPPPRRVPPNLTPRAYLPMIK